MLKKRRGPGRTPAEEDSADTSLAVRKWAEIVRTFGEHCDFFRKLDPAASVESSVEVLFHGKPASTLLKRASSVQLYLTWCAERGAPAVPVTEERVYEYFLELVSRGAPASRAFCFRESIAFCLGFLGLDGATGVLESRRVTGAAHKCMATKEADVETGALPVRALVLLERAVAGHLDDVPDADKVLCGFGAFCAHARARVGDARRISEEPVLDVDDNGRGYLEVRSVRHKTAARGSRRKLPFVAVARGASGAKWAQAWLAVRRAAGLDAKADDCLQLTPGAHGWLRSRIKTTVFGEWLVRFLRRHDSACLRPDLRISSRSLKVTILSWACKWGLSADFRRMLGYHAKKDDKSMMAYSRDELAAPLRQIEEMFAAIREGAFDPDSTRSGMVAAGPSGSSTAAAEAEPSADRGTTSSGSSSTSSEEKPPEELGPAPAAGVVLNVRTKVVHIDGGNGFVACGKKVPTKAEFHTSWPASEFQRCVKCFGG